MDPIVQPTESESKLSLINEKIWTILWYVMWVILLIWWLSGSIYMFNIYQLYSVKLFAARSAGSIYQIFALYKIFILIFIISWFIIFILIWLWYLCNLRKDYIRNLWEYISENQLINIAYYISLFWILLYSIIYLYNFIKCNIFSDWLVCIEEWYIYSACLILFIWLFCIPFKHWFIKLLILWYIPILFILYYSWLFFF